MKREYSKKAAPFLVAGFFMLALAYPLGRYFAQHSYPDAGSGFGWLGVFLCGLGFYYWAIAKGHSRLNFLWGFLSPVGLLVVALLKDKYADEELYGSEPVKNCPRCGAPYHDSDYRSDVAVKLCSQCRAALPFGP